MQAWMPSQPDWSLEYLAVQLGIEVFRLANREIPQRILGLVDADVAIAWRAVPVAEEGSTIVLAVCDPTNIDALDNLERMLGRPIRFGIAGPKDVDLALQKYYRR